VIGLYALMLCGGAARGKKKKGVETLSPKGEGVWHSSIITGFEGGVVGEGGGGC